MAITKLTQETEITSLNDSTEIQFVCPVCKSAKTLRFPQSIVIKAKGLTTMSIAKGLVCGHQFQAFVDKNFMVRGYQKVDFEFGRTLDSETTHKAQSRIKDDTELFKYLVLEGNYLEYRPNHKSPDKSQNSKKEKSLSRKLSLKEIYDDFWEFIDEDNEVFQDFIKEDSRKRELKEQHRLC